MYGGILLLGSVLVEAGVADPHLPLYTKLGQHAGLRAALSTENLGKYFYILFVNQKIILDIRIFDECSHSNATCHNFPSNKIINI